MRKFIILTKLSGDKFAIPISDIKKIYAEHARYYTGPSEDCTAVEHFSDIEKVSYVKESITEIVAVINGEALGIGEESNAI